MSLYGDLPQAKNASADATPASGWSNLMAPPALKKPAAAAFKPPPSVLRAAAAASTNSTPAATPAPGRGGPGRGTPASGRGGGRGAVLEGGFGQSSTAPSAAPTPLAPGAYAAPASALQPGTVTSSSIFTRRDGTPIEDEYDPMRPNDYEEAMALREKARKEAELEAERQAKIREMEEEFRRRKEQEEERARSAEAASSSSGGGGAGGMSMDEYERRRAAMGMTGEAAFARRGGLAAAGGGGGGGGGGGAGPGDDSAGPKGMSLAQKLLEKFGWREGEGLGKNRQGISTPLMAQKTDKRSAVIVNAPQAPRSFSSMPPPPPPGGVAADSGPDAKRPRAGATLTGAPSRVICMRNMVGPGQVDEELEDEVGQELSKYGIVQDVLIFEVTTPGYVEEEAVRIFVKFERNESATKAAVDLQARFFAGRTVRVSFFPEERFDATDLAPKAGEFD